MLLGNHSLAIGSILLDKSVQCPGKVFFVVMEPGVPECDWIFPSLKLQVRTILSLPLLEFFIHMMGRAFSRWASPHPIPAGKRCQCSNRMGMRCIYCTGSETNSIISENWTAWVTWRRIIDFVLGYYVLRDTVDKLEEKAGARELKFTIATLR